MPPKVHRRLRTDNNIWFPDCKLFPVLQAPANGLQLHFLFRQSERHSQNYSPIDPVSRYQDLTGLQQFLNAMIRKSTSVGLQAVSYTHLRAHETRHDLVCRLLLEKKK